MTLTASKRNGGFSVVEILVAIVIGAIGLMSLTQVFPLAGRSLNQSKRATEATLAGEEKLEQLRALALSHADLTAGTHADTTMISGAPYRRIWTVEDNKPLANVKRIRMRVMPAVQDTTNAVVITGLVGRR
jgi:prepilin-type N-terminal cleavage/methylation domain-containing protein